MKYQQFLEIFDKKLNNYFESHKQHVCCREGCADCCKHGDYPMSQLEFEYVMQGYIDLEDDKKQVVQQNIKNIQKGGVCPFLYNNLCIIYPYRPIVCRVHGLAYTGIKNIILPFCTNNGKNYSTVFDNNKILIKPITENLDTPSVLKDFDYGEIRTMYNWFKS